MRGLSRAQGSGSQTLIALGVTQGELVKNANSLAHCQSILIQPVGVGLKNVHFYAICKHTGDSDTDV